MTREQAKARLNELHDGRADRSTITDAEWAEIDRCEDVLAEGTRGQKMGYFPPCFDGRTVAEIFRCI